MNRQSIFGSSVRRRQDGFTIFETLIAFIVVAVGILAIMNFNSVAMRNNADAKTRAEAIECAQAKINQFRNFKDLEEFDDLLVNSGADENCDSGTNAALARSWSVDTGVSPAVLTVTVAWTDVEGNQQDVQLTSEIKSENIPQSVRNLAVVRTIGGSSSGGFGNWVGGDADTIPGREEIEVPWSGEGVPPDGVTWREEAGVIYVTLYKIKVYGQISVQGSIEVIGEDTFELVYDAEVVAVLGEVELPVPVGCTWGDTSYECITYYLNEADGWTGEIEYVAQGKNGSSAKFCVPVIWRNQLSPKTMTWQNELYDVVFPIQVTSPNGNCDAQGI